MTSSEITKAIYDLKIAVLSADLYFSFNYEASQRRPLRKVQ